MKTLDDEDAIFTEIMEGPWEDDKQQQVEELVNQAHLQTNGVLRCCLSLKEGSEYNHVFVFIVMQDVDKLYMILRFPDEF